MPMSERSRWLSTAALWSVRHRLPGRVRFYNPMLVGDHRFAHGVAIALRKCPGVSHVSASAASGSVLTDFDPSLQDEAGLLEAICHAHRSHHHWDDTLEAREVEAVSAARQSLAVVDRGVRAVTANRMTLRHVALSVFSYRALLRASAAGIPSLEAAESLMEIFVAWTLFRHPRLEREFARVEEYVTSPI